jgi:hypothetical protein
MWAFAQSANRTPPTIKRSEGPIIPPGRRHPSYVTQTSLILRNLQSRPQGSRVSRPAATAGQSPFPCAADAGRSVPPKFLYRLAREQSALSPLQQSREGRDSGTLAQSRCGKVRPRRCEARGATQESYQAPELISRSRSECSWSKSHTPSALRLRSPPAQLQPPIAQKLQHRRSPTLPRPLRTALSQHGTVASSRRSSDQQFQFAAAPQRSETPSVPRERRARPIRNAPGDPGLLSYPEFSFELSIAHTIRGGGWPTSKLTPQNRVPHISILRWAFAQSASRQIPRISLQVESHHPGEPRQR